MGNVATNSVHLLNDVVDVNPEFKVLHTLFLQLQPWKVITCRSLSQVFLKTIRSLIAGEVDPESSSDNSTALPNTAVTNDITSDNYHLLPASNFNVNTAKRMILALKLAGEPEQASEFDRQNYILSQLNLTSDAESLTAAFGGLLTFLGKSLAQINLQSFVNPVLAIRTLSLNNLVWIDNESLKALQIFTPTLHPSPYKWKEQVGEGLSILTLFNRCSSFLGSKRLRVLLSQPTQEISVIRERQDVIEFCLKNFQLWSNSFGCLHHLAPDDSVAPHTVYKQAHHFIHPVQFLLSD
ncbi:mutS protein homolog 5-like [Lycorma delicatula]|uniref:mutS protein homolog 5-like n=1 Tax=Lycorma delicatula TaxID=130591 RepID=UPI003F516919